MKREDKTRGSRKMEGQKPMLKMVIFPLSPKPFCSTSTGCQGLLLHCRNDIKKKLRNEGQGVGDVKELGQNHFTMVQT